MASILVQTRRVILVIRAIRQASPGTPDHQINPGKPADLAVGTKVRMFRKK